MANRLRTRTRTQGVTADAVPGNALMVERRWRPRRRGVASVALLIRRNGGDVVRTLSDGNRVVVAT